MRLTEIIYFLFFIPLFFGCRQEKNHIAESDEGNKKTDQSAPVLGRSKTYHGLFVSGKNMRSFRDCDHPEDDYSVIDSTGQMDELYNTIFLHSPAFPYEYVYVEVKGMIQAASPGSDQKDFDSTITIKQILTFEQKNYRNTCMPYDFWALGNNPDWSLQVSASEGIIGMKDFTNNTVYLFEYFSPKVVNDEVFIYSSTNYANQTAVNIIFKKEPCNDGAFHNQYLYSATAVINGIPYNGCAIRGGVEK